MRFSSKHCFFSAALFIAAAAHADSGVGMSRNRAERVLTLRAADRALDHDARRNPTQEADALAAPCRPEAAQAKSMAADRAEQSARVNPDLQKIWSGP